MPAPETLDQPAIDETARSHIHFRRITHRGTPLALHVRYQHSDFGSSGPYVADTFGRTTAYLCVLQLHDFPPSNGWRDGRQVDVPLLPTDSLMVLDLRHEWRNEVSAPFDNIHLNIAQSHLDELAEECGAQPAEISLPPFAPQFDDTLRHLALSLKPAFRRPAELTTLFAEHVTIAAALHLAHAYGGRPDVAKRFAKGLAPWQERRARDFITGHLAVDVDLAGLAAACGLSRGHFAKAFRNTVGMPPHRWLLKQRVERACDLLLSTSQPLEDIALACGFADQSHLSRVFGKATGLAPGTWRRVRRS